MRTRLLPYGASNSARDLARSLGILRLRTQGSRFRPRRTDTVVNWGSSQGVGDCRYINNPAAVSNASNKLTAFRILAEHGVPPTTVPEFTTSKEDAEIWRQEGSSVVCRTMLRANSGRGIVIINPTEGGDRFSIPDAPLYTKYIKKSQEYRVHVFNGEVKDTQRKMRKQNVPDEAVNWQIRNLAGGFIFGREGVLPDTVRDNLAVQAVQALGLHFGAVDIIYNNYHDQYYVLEVNTAPGLEGTTLEVYTDAINAILGEQNV